MSYRKNDQKEKRKTLINVVIAAASIIVVGAGLAIWLTPWVWYDTSPKPLGDKMEYIGKFDYGCAGFPCMGGPPGSTYYYATDMNIEEVEGYFREAKLREKPLRDSETTSIWLHNNGRHEGFVLDYYNEGHMDREEQRQFGLKETDKHVIKINAEYYHIAKDSL